MVEQPSPGVGALAVLVVDDHDLVRSMCDLVLRRHGVDATALGSGAEAVRWLGAHDVDVVVTDVVLPGDVSGADLVALAAARVPPVGVVAMSGYADVAERVGGAVVVLRKPFTADELVAAVRQASDDARARHAAGPAAP